MPVPTKQSKAKTQRKTRPGTRKSGEARPTAIRAFKEKTTSQSSKTPDLAPETKTSRSRHQKWVAKGLDHARPLAAAGELFTAAMHEAREVLDPPALMIALVAIGMLKEKHTGETLHILIENILINLAGDSLPV